MFDFSLLYFCKNTPMDYLSCSTRKPKLKSSRSFLADLLRNCTESVMRFRNSFCHTQIRQVCYPSLRLILENKELIKSFVDFFLLTLTETCGLTSVAGWFGWSALL